MSCALYFLRPRPSHWSRVKKAIIVVITVIASVGAVAFVLLLGLSGIIVVVLVGIAGMLIAKAAELARFIKGRWAAAARFTRIHPWNGILVAFVASVVLLIGLTILVAFTVK